MGKCNALLLLVFFSVCCISSSFALFGLFEDTDKTDIKINSSNNSQDAYLEIPNYSFQEAADAEQAALQADLAITLAADKATQASEKAKIALEDASNLVKKLEDELKVKKLQVNNLKTLVDRVNNDAQSISKNLETLYSFIGQNTASDSFAYEGISGASNSLKSAIESSNMAVDQAQNTYKIASEELSLAEEELQEAKKDLARKQIESTYTQEIAQAALQRVQNAKLLAVKRSEQFKKLSNKGGEENIETSDQKSIDLNNNFIGEFDDKITEDLESQQVDQTQAAPKQTQPNQMVQPQQQQPKQMPQPQQITKPQQPQSQQVTQPQQPQQITQPQQPQSQKMTQPQQPQQITQPQQIQPEQ